MALIDREEISMKIRRFGAINSDFFAELIEKEPPVQLPILSCEGYKMFHGIMRLTPKNPKFHVKEIEADWLYKPEYKCWYGHGCSYPEEMCERIG